MIHRCINPNFYDVAPADEMRLMALRGLVGRRQFRAARLFYGHGLTQHQIARRLRVSQSTISRDIEAVETAGRFAADAENRAEGFRLNYEYN